MSKQAPPLPYKFEQNGSLLVHVIGEAVIDWHSKTPCKASSTVFPCFYSYNKLLLDYRLKSFTMPVATEPDSPESSEGDGVDLFSKWFKVELLNCFVCFIRIVFEDRSITGLAIFDREFIEFSVLQIQLSPLIIRYMFLCLTENELHSLIGTWSELRDVSLSCSCCRCLRYLCLDGIHKRGRY